MGRASWCFIECGHLAASLNFNRGRLGRKCIDSSSDAIRVANDGTDSRFGQANDARIFRLTRGDSEFYGEGKTFADNVVGRQVPVGGFSSVSESQFGGRFSLCEDHR